MRFKFIVLSVALILTQLVLAVQGADKKVCITFDKLPYMEPNGFWTPRELSNLILRGLARKEIEAVGFVIQEKIDDDPGSYIIVEDWVKGGHIVGNATYSFIDFNEVSTTDLFEHIRDGQKAIRIASRNGEHTYRYFRFPLLHEGNTESKKKDAAKALYRADYTTVPVSIVTYDYQFNHLIVKVEEREEVVERIRKHYLDYLSRCLDYAEKQSELVFGRQINQIIQLHPGIATAFFIDDLLELLEARGYSFVTVKEALEDPAYKTEETYIGPLGLSFIDRVAATQGKPFDPEFVEIGRREIERQVLSEEADPQD